MLRHASYQALIGFDFGLKRIGVATANTTTRIATPLTILHAQNGVPNWTDISLIIDEWSPDLFVIGLPLNMDDSDGRLCSRAKKFARRVSARFNKRAVMVDERLSSHEATKIRPSGKIDDLAATFILETWLNAPSSASNP
ncbi:MAG: Holliday junction resolvase RuvX [Cellvibrionales bacterium TMED49]|nr:Holliday junction resolvase RuvX [Porticoccaceae bacterium]OUU38631.1 MAG: Holliday junction resolvase RuvX [Cellvibrionales bacterium TMED49]|tara:strand:- start:183 stop:602 length:420 start_codon:yes stop_codon:yes gene_type:complete